MPWHAPGQIKASDAYHDRLCNRLLPNVVRLVRLVRLYQTDSVDVQEPGENRTMSMLLMTFSSKVEQDGGDSFLKE